MAKGRHIPPSRKRYEESHPVIAIRVDKDLYDKAKDIKETNNVSFADIFKQGLGIQEAAMEEAFDIALKEGKEEGLDEGRKFDLGICTICEKALHWDLGRAKDRQLLEKAINNARYIHVTCEK